MSFRRRPYREVLDNLLTGLVGGVTGEAHPFPPSDGSGPFKHLLKKPDAASVVSVYGQLNGSAAAFTQDTDYELGDGNTLLWLSGGQQPDAGTVFEVNYLTDASRSPYNDLHVGSVLRTLAESVGLEVARLYAQLELVYQSGFIDTATGSALDNVVALLGISRVRPGRFAGELEFERVRGAQGSIYIPAGTRVMTQDGSVEYETIKDVTLADGQVSVRVDARDLEENTEGLSAAELALLAKPIAGIGAVRNPSPTALDQRGENDVELRARAKGFLHGSERATLAAISEAALRQGVQAEVVEELDTGGLPTGVVHVIPHGGALAPDLLVRVKTAIEQVRPAGVAVLLQSGVVPATVDLTLRIETDSALLEPELRSVQQSIREKIADYFARLPLKESGSVNKLVGLVLRVPQVEDLQIVSARLAGTGTPLDLSSGQLGVAGKTTQLGALEIIDPNLPTQLRVVISYPIVGVAPDPAAVSLALETLIAKVNTLNAGPAPAVAALGDALLLYVTPLPLEAEDKPQGSFEQFAAAPVAISRADLDPYRVEFTFTKPSRVAESVLADGDSYALAAFERLTLAGVELVPEAEDA